MSFWLTLKWCALSGLVILAALILLLALTGLGDDRAAPRSAPIQVTHDFNL